MLFWGEDIFFLPLKQGCLGGHYLINSSLTRFVYCFWYRT